MVWTPRQKKACGDTGQPYSELNRLANWFKRSIQLPADVASKGVTVTCKKGVLRVFMPKQTPTDATG